MDKYKQRNSKRKIKARAALEAKELCVYHSKTLADYDNGAVLCVTPDEFMRLEAIGTRTPVEKTRIKRRLRHKEPRLLGATA